MPFRVIESTAWRAWVTPKAAKSQPIHRWYLLPHSFTGDLVHALIDEWHLDETDNLLDPFAGAGTTLLAAKERGIPGSGYDLSPLAVLARIGALVGRSGLAMLARCRIATTPRVWSCSTVGSAEVLVLQLLV